MRSIRAIFSREPRFAILLFFSGCVFDQLVVGALVKTPIQLGLSLIGFLGVDIVINWIKLRRIIFPLSGLVSSFGTFLLIASPVNWPFFVSGCIGASSKHFLTFKGNHVFNPVNFASLMMLFFLSDVVQSAGGLWSGDPLLLAYLYLTGFALVALAKRWVLSVSYILGFLLVHFVALRSSLPVNLLQVASPSFALFTFYMISDPKTTPNSTLGQIVFAVAVAMIEGFLKSRLILNASLWGLLCVALAFKVTLASSDWKAVVRQLPIDRWKTLLKSRQVRPS